jgi:beta-glucanase (GH16 family)
VSRTEPARDRSIGSPPPVAPPLALAPGSGEDGGPDVELLEDPEFARAIGAAPRSLPPHAIEPHGSYRLTVVARVEGGPGSGGKVWVRFREPARRQTVRSFHCDVVGAVPQTYTLSFEAPGFAELAELAIESPHGALTVDRLSLRRAPPVVHTQPVASWKDSYAPEGYELAFNDEFEGVELDRSKWFTRLIWNSETLDHLEKEQERYSDHDNHVVKDGVLRLTARSRPDAAPGGASYESGMIRSDWTTLYGYFEARVKMPAGLGVWPAFWVISDVSSTGRLTWPPEIDFFEFAYNGRDDTRQMIHFGLSELSGSPNRYLFASDAFKTRNRDFYAPFDFSAGWHTIGAEWTPDAVTNYVDGVKIVSRTYRWVYKDGEPAPAGHVMLNLAIGGPWAGRYGVDDTAFPQSFDVDWVRVYHKRDR